ncbi:hypothetical protein ACFPRL_16165 [Pseudoclavibacter helvolus]
MLLGKRAAAFRHNFASRVVRGPTGGVISRRRRLGTTQLRPRRASRR